MKKLQQKIIGVMLIGMVLAPVSAAMGAYNEGAEERQTEAAAFEQLGLEQSAADEN